MYAPSDANNAVNLADRPCRHYGEDGKLRRLKNKHTGRFVFNSVMRQIILDCVNVKLGPAGVPLCKKLFENGQGIADPPTRIFVDLVIGLR